MRLSHSLILASLTAIVSSKAIRGPKVEVHLKATEGSVVTVRFTNKGDDEVNFFRRNNILDPVPIKKVNVTSKSGDAHFIGAHARVSKENLNKDSFVSIKRKKSVDVTFNLADMYDVSHGGQFTLIAEGGIPWAKKKSTEILGTVPFKSNNITINVDKSSRIPLSRNIMQSDCTAGRLDASRSANNVCSFMAMGAALAALHGDNDQFFRYFRTTDPAMRQLVARRFIAVSEECSGKNNVATTFCSDALGLCQSDYISVTLGNKITNCDLFWRFPVLTDKCHGYDQATLTIHETTHVDGLVGLAEVSTVDFRNNYGWPALSYLAPEQAVTNADNYQYYANSVYVGRDC